MSKWVDVAAENEFGPGQTRLVTVGSIDIGIFNLDGKYFALEDVCTHDGSPMLGCGLAPEEIIEGDQIICPRHGARFCIRTGAALTPPAYEPVTCYPVRIKDGIVQTCDDRRE